MCIGRKLVLAKRRDTVYAVSKDGFSLRKTAVLSIGGSSLKWSRSIENNSKKACEVLHKLLIKHFRDLFFTLEKRRIYPLRCLLSIPESLIVRHDHIKQDKGKMGVLCAYLFIYF